LTILYIMILSSQTHPLLSSLTSHQRSHVSFVQILDSTGNWNAPSFCSSSSAQTGGVERSIPDESSEESMVKAKRGAHGVLDLGHLHLGASHRVGTQRDGLCKSGSDGLCFALLLCNRHSLDLRGRCRLCWERAHQSHSEFPQTDRSEQAPYTVTAVFLFTYKNPDHVPGFLYCQLTIETILPLAGVDSVYFTASLRAFAGRNLGTRIAGTEIDSPVRGFRAIRAARVLVEKMPSPAIDTSPPFFREETIESITVSTTSSACTFVPPSLLCTASTIATLFIY
jgi:hypothetical protein